MRVMDESRVRHALVGGLLAFGLLSACSVSGSSDASDKTTTTHESSPPAVTTTTDATTTTSTSTTTSTTSTTVASTTTAVVHSGSVVGHWEGTYTCGQGLTHLDLTVDEDLTATFVFKAVPQNPGVPSGRYSMTGSLDGDLAVFEPDAWIDRPGSYVMVGLRGQVDTTGASDRFTGTVPNTACTTFDLTRA